MISHKHKCIFIHIPKAAGTSIERFFMEDLGLDMENRHALLLGANTNKHIGPRRVSHLTIREMIEGHYISQDLLEDYYKFAFVRNPFTRIFSTYKYLKYHRFISFDVFVQNKIDELIRSERYGYFLKPQFQYIYSEDLNLMVDFVGKLENIGEDFKTVQHHLNFNKLPLKHFNKSNRSSSNSAFFGLSKFIIKEKKSVVKNLSLKKDKAFILSENGQQKLINIYKNDFELFNYPKELSPK